MYLSELLSFFEVSFNLWNFFLLFTFTQEETFPLRKNLEKSFAYWKDFCLDFSFCRDEGWNLDSQLFIFNGFDGSLSRSRVTAER